MDYGKTTPILWRALQTALNRIEKLEKEVAKLREALPSVKALKEKGKGKSDSD